MERALVALLYVCGAVSAAVTLLISAFLLLEAVEGFHEIGVARFVTDETWDPAEGVAAGAFNLTPMIVGTVACTSGAMLLASPAGLLLAIFATFYAPRWLASVYRHLLELLAGIPSVVFGLWGLVTLTPLIRRIEPPGPSLLAGILILSLMILPTVTLLSTAALQAVPRSYQLACSALALSRWRTIWQVMVPAAWPGIGAALILAAARALGETMAVLMVCGNVVQSPTSLFAPVRTLTANIALELGYAMGAHRAALFVSGFVLLLMVVTLVYIAARIRRRQLHA